MIDDKEIDKVVEIIKKSKNIVIFTGAGHSTESGIDDFRSPGGLWDRYDPSIYASYHYFLQDPSKFWEMHNELEDILTNAEPNPGHHAIAELEKLGKVNAIITQNIDMLHQRAGSGSYKNIPIYELHGSYGALECVRCGNEFKYDDIDTKSVKFPVCECGGYIKPNVVLFGEALPANVLENAMRASSNCDCFILIGSSLTVAPANFMPGIAKKGGAKVIFINKDNTEMDYLADIFLKDYAAPILQKIIKKLKI
ncbi:MAG: NAD-dependent deacetylase [Promethearchaeota archaeon]